MAIETNPDISSLTRHAQEVAAAQAALRAAMAQAAAQVNADRAAMPPPAPQR
jgi:hypothetical protein